MGDVKIKCPHCMKSISAPQGMLGRTVKCPSCSGRFRIDPPSPSPNAFQNPQLRPAASGDITPIRRDASVAALAKIQAILTKGETISTHATQELYLPFRPDTVAVTSNRVVVCRDGFFGARYDDFLWIDLADATIAEHILRATVTFRLVSGRVIVLGKLTKADARRIYALCQESEQNARYIRRQHELESARAAAGHVVVGQSPVQPPPSLPQQATFSATAAPDPVERLKKLKALFDAQLITEDEFCKRKAEIISST